jgi:hypothetical protein
VCAGIVLVARFRFNTRALNSGMPGPMPLFT